MRPQQTCTYGYLVILTLGVARLYAVPAQPIVGPMQDRAGFDSSTGREADGFIHHVEAIQAEIEQIGDHPWAGVYRGPRGATITLAPNTGCTYLLRGSLGVYVQKWGVVVEDSDGILHVPFEPTWRDIHRDGLDTQLVPVAWGPKRYLLSVDDVGEFCNAVYSKYGEPRRMEHWGQFYMRQDDAAGPICGLPKLPEPYRPYLHTTTICAKIIDVISIIEPAESDSQLRMRESHVRIDVGGDEGLMVGSVLEVCDNDDGFPCRLIVTRVESATAEGDILHIISDDKRIDPGQPAVGWDLVSGPRDVDRHDVETVSLSEEYATSKADDTSG